MNEKSILDYLLTQGPTILFMGLVNYFQYRYFTSTLKSKDATFEVMLKDKDVIIKTKDDELRAMHKETVEMVRQHLESTNKTNEVMNGLKGLLEVIQKDLRDKK